MESEALEKLVAAEVERVFQKRGWKTFAEAEIATRFPVGTLQRLRKGLGKADTIIKFGVAVGEPEDRWKRIAVGLNENSEASPPIEKLDLDQLLYELDPDVAEVVKYYQGLPPEMRPAVKETLKGMRTAADVVREQREAITIGKRADRDDNPSSRNSRPNDATDEGNDQ